MGKQLNKSNNKDKGRPGEAALNSLSEVPIVKAREILQSLPEPQRETLELFIKQTSVRHSGPLPNPESYDKYEQVLPGAAARCSR